MAEASILQNMASQAGAAPAPALRAGQVVAAQVAAILKDGLVRLALPQGMVDVTPPAPLAQGMTVKLEVVKAGPELLLRLIDPPAAAPAAARPQAAPPPPASMPTPASMPPPPPARNAAPLPSAALPATSFSAAAAPQASAALKPAGVPSAAAPTPAAPTPAGPIPAAPTPAAPAQATSTPVLPRPIPVTVVDAAGASPRSAQGQPLEGRVVALGDNGAMRIATTAGEITVTARAPVPLGATVRIAPPSGSAPALLTIQPPAQGSAAPPPATGAAPAEAGSVRPAPAVPSGPPAPGPAAARGPVVTTDAPSEPPPPLPGAQRAVLLPALQGAMGRQQGLGPLMANLGTALAAPAAPALPRDTLAAMARVLGAAQPLDPSVEAGDIARAVAASGVLYEARLAGGAPPAQLAGDLKGALLLLRNALSSFLGDRAAPAAPPPDPAANPPPPLKGDAPAAQRPATPTLTPEAAPEEIARTLLHQTEGALARTRMMQIASLPDDGLAARAAPAALQAEVPVLIGQQMAVVQFAVERDGHGTEQDSLGEGPLWRLRFALDVEPMGPVHALIALRGGQASVTLWADRAATARDLSEASGELREALGGADFTVDEIHVLRGAPLRPAREPGVVLDRRS